MSVRIAEAEDEVVAAEVEPGRSESTYMVYAVLIVFVQGVQMFMSYDGGATTLSVSQIPNATNPAECGNPNQTAECPWTDVTLGLVGSMDKIAMVGGAVCWGRVLQLCPVKLLLVIGLGLNSVSCFVFGTSSEMALLLAAKTVMGVTQSLQGVWGTVWTITHAPADRRTVWLGFAAISAGIGNGLGSAIAGWFTYSFAYKLQAFILGGVWIFLLFVPQTYLVLPEEADEIVLDMTSCVHGSNQLSFAASPHASHASFSLLGAGSKLASVAEARGASFSSFTLPGDSSFAGASAVSLAGHESGGVEIEAEADDAPLGIWTQVQMLRRTPLYVLTALTIASIAFLTSGIQFLWDRLFLHTWGLATSINTLTMLIGTGIGGAVGVFLGPQIIDRCGGFQDGAGVVRSLKILCFMWLASCLAAALAFVGLVSRGQYLAEGGHVDEKGLEDATAWFCLVGLSAVFAAVNATNAASFGMNTLSVPKLSRPFASGVTLSVMNLLGYSAGPLLPSLFMQYMSYGAKKTGVPAEVFAMTMVLSVTVFAFGMSWVAQCIASGHVRRGIGDKLMFY